jgi:two-component system sensor histidine kinase/response regulator
VPAGLLNKLVMNRILVVDDDANVREAVVEVLQSRGYQTLVADGADAGKSLAVSQAPDLVISDIMMPGKDGYTLLSEFREDSATAAIPFILMTGVDTRDRYRAGMDLGADDYLAKPFTGEQLDKAIKACLKKNSLVVSRADEKVANLLNILENTLPHELRTPLNGILGFSEMLKTCPEKFSQDEIVQAAECINTSAKRLHRLVENLLMSARVRVMRENSESFGGTDQKSGFEFVPLVEHLAKDYAEQYGREADLDLITEGEITCNDPQVVCKALEEIIDNAFKFSEKDTPVCVAFRSVDGKTQISVEDHGRGMEPEQVARIDVFRQFDRSHFEQQGAGLGLFIAKQVIFEFGGGFEVESLPGTGTKIIVTLYSAALSFRNNRGHLNLC